MATKQTHRTNRHVIVLGINHTSSSTDLRDRLIFSDTLKNPALKQLSGWEGILESVIVSTCNRMEIYAVVTNVEQGKTALFSFISTIHSIPIDEFKSNMYFYRCKKAIQHIYYVVSSLDSMVIGEHQILGQVKNAYRRAMLRGNTGTILNKLFHLAIEAGKRVRTETLIGKGAVSVSSVAVDLASKILGNLDSKAALIIGAGEMSKLTARHLVTAGIHTVYFTNRTKQRAVEMAQLFNGKSVSFDRMFEMMELCDIVLTSTGAPHFIIEKDRMVSVMKKRKNRAIFLIDIAAPRDINPDIRTMDNIFLYSIDDLTMAVKDNASMRKAEIEKVKDILKEEWDKYCIWYESLKVLPTLISLRTKFETMCHEELQRYSSDIAKVPEPSQKLIQQFALSLTKKYLRIPSRVMKDMSITIDPVILAESVSQLFELDKHNRDETSNL